MPRALAVSWMVTNVARKSGHSHLRGCILRCRARIEEQKDDTDQNGSRLTKQLSKTKSANMALSKCATNITTVESCLVSLYSYPAVVGYEMRKTSGRRHLTRGGGMLMTLQKNLLAKR